MLSSISSLRDDEEDVSYDVESLFKNILTEETINHIIEQPPPWTSKPQKSYKRNTINGDLHRSKTISPNCDKEIPLVKEKFMKADSPLHFIKSVVN